MGTQVNRRKARHNELIRGLPERALSDDYGCPTVKNHRAKPVRRERQKKGKGKGP